MVCETCEVKPTCAHMETAVQQRMQECAYLHPQLHNVTQDAHTFKAAVRAVIEVLELLFHLIVIYLCMRVLFYCN